MYMVLCIPFTVCYVYFIQFINPDSLWFYRTRGLKFTLFAKFAVKCLRLAGHCLSQHEHA